MIATVKRDGAGYPVTESQGVIGRDQLAHNAALAFAQAAAAQKGVIAALLILIHAKHAGKLLGEAPHNCPAEDCRLARAVVEAAGVRI